MAESDTRFLQLIGALKERDYRLTPQRLELVRMIATSDGHPNASQLFKKIKLVFPTISQATVYKTLAIFKDIGQVFEIDLHGDSHYDGKRPNPHPHLVCLDCNRIIDGEVVLDEDSVRRVVRISGFMVLRQHITLYGLCPECQAEKGMNSTRMAAGNNFGNT